MPIAIRIDPDSAQRQSITLNGLTFFIRVTYNSTFKSNNWFIDIFDQQNNNLLVGRRVTVGANLTYLSSEVTNLLNGYLFCENTGGIREPINRDNFGHDKNYQIWLWNKDEINGTVET